jgi:hypothetical protein
MSFLQRLLSADFAPHGYCFLWFPEILWLGVVSDALIAVAYFAIRSHSWSWPGADASCLSPGCS